ncbi:hypothetical protein CAQU_02140 [Corynebacterium aquilae DSM 44791]|uniref:Type VII secretion protein EccB n=2 Tax=Corynebacterium aquilae TaxID=203263 RepID=A0A1L7CE01_9CORY|nr:hypothetical protein CAQU_02140 [Corynebacterium aquilae DSM 44791]
MGHNFLVRRVTHGLLLGDIRMIHEPLRARRRGLVFGALASVLGCVAAAGVAFFAPQPRPGEAPIVRSDAGALYAHVDGKYHPVLNLTSAQLIAGAPQQPAKIGTQVLAEAEKGVVVGIPDAPAVGAATVAEDTVVGVCQQDQRSIVVVDGGAKPLPEGEVIVARGLGSEWLLTAQGRAELPPANSREGVAVRRGLGITPLTPVFSPPDAVLAATALLPPIAVPDVVRVLQLPHQAQLQGNAPTEGQPAAFGQRADGDVVALTATQLAIVQHMGTPTREVTAEELQEFADSPLLPLQLPAQLKAFVDPGARTVCIQGADTVVATREQPLPPGTPLSGTSQAGFYVGPGHSVLADTGGGWWLVSDVGRAHAITSVDDAQALGLGAADQSPVPAAYAIIRLLPEGPALSRQAALQPRY